MNKRQQVYDAIKAAREQGEAWLTYRGERMHLVNPDVVIQEAYTTPVMDAFVRTRRGWGVQLASVWWHDSLLRCSAPRGKSIRRGRDNIVLAIVMERYPL